MAPPKANGAGEVWRASRTPFCRKKPGFALTSGVYSHATRGLPARGPPRPFASLLLAAAEVFIVPLEEVGGVGRHLLALNGFRGVLLRLVERPAHLAGRDFAESAALLRAPHAELGVDVQLPLLFFLLGAGLALLGRGPFAAGRVIGLLAQAL